jgi:hypothetical protein
MSVATALLAEYETAISKVLQSQAYSMGGRSMTRANLLDLEAGRDKYKREVARETNGGIQVNSMTPMDE